MQSLLNITRTVHVRDAIFGATEALSNNRPEMSMKSWAITLGLLITLATACLPPMHAQQPKVTVIANETFSSNSSTQLQRFNASINLTPQQLAGPLTLKFTNGGNGSRFAWVRVFFNPGRSNASPNAQPSGVLIVNENSFKGTDNVSLDVSGRMAARNLLMIMGAGQQGAQLSYELISTEVKGVQITSVDPPEVASGGSLTVKGAGFDASPNNNTVKIYNRAVPVSKASPTELEVTVPKGLQPFAYTVDVTVNGVKSNTYQFRVMGPPELGGCSGYGLVPGSSVQITGRNFATKPEKNVVTFIAGDVKKRAAITAASKDSITITVPDFPELQSKLNAGVPTPAQISIATNGVEAAGQLSIFISIRPMAQ